jgi:hypothetical protein
VIEIVRKLWQSVEEKSEEPDQAKLKADIARSITLLRGRIEKNLGASSRSFQERLLLRGLEEVEHQPSLPVKERLASPRFTDPLPKIYDKDFVDHTLSHIPAAINFSTLEDYRTYLVAKIRCNSEGTRRRTASHLIARYFPGETLHRDLAEFAAKMAGKPALSDALFYLTCRMEPIVASVADDVVFPCLPEGGVEFRSSCSPNSQARSLSRT